MMYAATVRLYSQSAAIPAVRPWAQHRLPVGGLHRRRKMKIASTAADRDSSVEMCLDACLGAADKKGGPHGGALPASSTIVEPLQPTWIWELLGMRFIECLSIRADEN
jgi:hypothetical protein